jgi:hypothetical protein
VAFSILIKLDSNPVLGHPQDFILGLVIVSLYLVGTVLGLSGAMVYFSKPRTGAPMLFVAGTISLIPLSFFLWEFYGYLAPTFFPVAYFTSTALLLVAGTMAIISRQAPVKVADAQTRQK